MAFVQAFLAVVFLAGAWGKRRSDWPSRLVAYGLWSEAASRRVAVIVPFVEALVAIGLIVSGTIGLVAAGAVLLIFGSVLGVALVARFKGSCGCSAGGQVSRLTAVRAYLWGALALGLGILDLSGDVATAIALTAGAWAVGTLAVLTSVRLLPGPRGQLLFSPPRGGRRVSDAT